MAGGPGPGRRARPQEPRGGSSRQLRGQGAPVPPPTHPPIHPSPPRPLRTMPRPLRGPGSMCALHRSPATPGSTCMGATWISCTCTAPAPLRSAMATPRPGGRMERTTARASRGGSGTASRVRPSPDWSLSERVYESDEELGSLGRIAQPRTRCTDPRNMCTADAPDGPEAVRTRRLHCFDQQSKIPTVNTTAQGQASLDKATQQTGPNR